MSFYKPFTDIIKSKPVVIYPELGLEKLMNRELTGCIEQHLEKIYSNNKKHLSAGELHIAIVWAEDEDIMCDIWLFENIANWKDNPTIDVKNFRGLSFEEGYGVTAGDGLMILGKEEEFRRSTATIDQYLDTERPAIENLILEQGFYD